MELLKHGRANILPSYCNNMLIFGKRPFFIMYFQNIAVNPINCMKNSRWRVNFLRCQRSLEEISPALQANNFINLVFVTSSLYHSIPGGNLTPSPCLKGHRQPQVFAGVQAIGAIFCNTETSIS